MTALSIQPPYPIFTEADGSPLENGFVYIGTANLDPVANPIAVYWDAALTVPAAQPIRTLNGYPSRNGTPARLYVGSDYSIRVNDAKGVTVYSAPAATERWSNVVVTGADASEVNFLQAGAGAQPRTAQSKLRDVVSVKDFGAVGNGVADDTAAIQNAINSFASGNGQIEFPAGTYRVTSQLTVSNDRIHLVGAGAYATQILFDPTANQTCLRLAKSTAAILNQGSVRGMAFFSNNSTYAKIAIELVDGASYWFDDIAISGSVVAIPGSQFWSGGSGSTGLVLRGREACKVSRVIIYADTPVRLDNNPNNIIDVDHFHFQDTYLGAANNPCMVIADGVNVTNLSIDGYNAWVLGTDGLYWVDTTSTMVSQNVAIRGVRFEQGQNASSWAVRIEHNTQLQSLLIEDCQCDLGRNGYRFRKASGVSIGNNVNAGAAGRTVLDVDSTVQGLELRECFWQAGASASMSGQVLVFGSPNPLGAAPLPPSARYQSSTMADKRTRTDMANGGYLITVANGATVGLGPNTTAGMLTVIDSEYLSATFNLRGTYLVTSEVADPASAYSAAAGTASSTNVYWSAANSRYELQNNRGASRNYLIVLDGTYTNF